MRWLDSGTISSMSAPAYTCLNLTFAVGGKDEPIATVPDPVEEKSNHRLLTGSYVSFVRRKTHPLEG